MNTLQDKAVSHAVIEKNKGAYCLSTDIIFLQRESQKRQWEPSITRNYTSLI